MIISYSLPEAVNKLIGLFEQAGYQIYIVGGAVRDILMNRPVKDWDFTTDAQPEKILQLLPQGFYDNKFGTVGVPAERLLGLIQVSSKKESKEILEITTMREEGEYQDFRHPQQIIWTNDLFKDLSRRDFTINAIAAKKVGEKELEIIDPYQGQEDLQRKLIRAVGDPDARFREDALRMIRAIRLAAELKFQIETSTFQAIQRNAHLLQEISQERIRDEFLRILESEQPDEGIHQLRQTGILAIILPELERCFGVKQEGPKHQRTYDVGEHSILSLKYCPSPDPITRFATLIHDIGKPDTYAVEEDGNVTFYHHEVVGAQLAEKIAERFRLSRKQKDKLIRLVRWHLFTVDERQTDSAIRRFVKNVGVENLDDMFALREGDRLGGGTTKPTSWRLELFKQRVKKVLEKPFTVADLAVDGHDVMQIFEIPPGRKVGEILQDLFQEVLEDPQKNNRKYLLERIKKMKDQEAEGKA